MKIHRIAPILFVVLVLTSPQTFAQQDIRQLREKWQKSKDDVSRTDALLSLGKAMMDEKSDSAHYYFHQGLVLSEKAELKTQQAIFQTYIGMFHYNANKYDSATQYCQNAYALFSERGELFRDAEIKNKKNTLHVGKLLLLKARLLDNRYLYDSSYVFYKEASEFLMAANDSVNAARCFLNIGATDYYNGYYDKAVVAYGKAADWVKTSGDTLLSAKVFTNLGLLHKSQGNYTESVANFQKSQNLLENTQHIGTLANVHFNLGILFWELKNFNESLERYKKALKTYEKLNSVEDIANIYNNMGMVYSSLEDTVLAIECFEKSIGLSAYLKNKTVLASSYLNKGMLLPSLGRKAERESLILKALDLYREKNYRLGIYVCYANLCRLYSEESQYQKAIEYANKAIGIQDIDKPIKYVSQNYSVLAGAYTAMGNHKKANEFYRKNMGIQDSIFTLKVNEQVADIQTRYETEKKEQQIKNQQLIIEKSNTEMQRQRQLRNGLVAGSLLLLVVLALLLWGYSLKVRSNRIVLEKNSLLEQANEEINAQKDELERQRDMVVQQNMFIEQQNRHITGSIAYAQLIQNAVLPPDAILQNCLGEYFVIFKPKEVVSGDFYWATRLEHIVVFAVADCTGHGVPGAFTSMLGLTLLKEIVLRQEVTSPGQALDTLRNALIESLQQRFSPGAQRDGLEIALCAFDTKTRQLQFSGANIGLLIVKPNNEIQKLKPSSQPVAAHYNMKPFTTMSVQLEANDVLYIATDGFQDQFGGPQKKKFMSKNLHSLLLSVAQKPMREQKQILEHTFDNWKGNVEQIDDVTILGLKL